MSAPRLNALAAPVLATLLLLLSASAGAVDGTDAAPDTLALVNGAPVTRDLLNVFSLAAMGRSTDELNEGQRAGLLDALIRAEIIAQAAEKLGLTPKNELDLPDSTRAQVEFGRLQAMNQAAFVAFERDHAPNDQDLQAEYQRQIALVPSIQYHAHHILLKSEEAAAAVIKQLKAGADFAALAKQESIDPSGQNGGDLGWFSPKVLPESLAAALKSMKKGEVSGHPVQSSYGWHVLRLDETRTLVPPTFESMHDKLDQAARTQKLEAYVSGLLKSAQVQKF